MSEGRKPLTGEQQDAAWKLARKHSLMLLEQGSQAFDDALFAFCADLIDGQKTAPLSWWRCDTHGPGTIKAWGCPECVREMREELANRKNATEQALTDAYAEGRKDQAEEATACPCCGGSGEIVVMEGGGPDAYEVPANCDHCGGSGGLDDAYANVVKQLAKLKARNLQLVGLTYFGDNNAAT